MPSLIAQGESPSVEFKREIPKQADDLAKEIASFSTSGAGVILLGIEDDGTIVGVPNLDASQARDDFVNRIQGICKAIRPVVRPHIRMSSIAGRGIVAIEISKGTEPVYYVNHRPYGRHLRSAAPLEPDEVIGCVMAWLRETGQIPPPAPSPAVAFLSDLHGLLVQSVIQLESFADREVDPWAHQIKILLKIHADTARHLALRVPVDFPDAPGELEAFANALDAIVHAREYVGDGDDRDQLVVQAQDVATTLRANYLAKVTLPHDVLLEQALATGKACAQFSSIVDRMAEENRWDEIQRKAGKIGLEFVTIATHGQGLGGPDGRAALLQLGRDLRAAEIANLNYGDGGQTADRVVATIREARERFSALVPIISQPV